MRVGLVGLAIALTAGLVRPADGRQDDVRPTKVSTRPPATVTATDELQLDLRVEGPTLHPGDVSLIVATTSRRVDAVAGEAFGRPLRFWPAAPGEWRALVGAALDTKAGAYEYQVAATAPDGAAASARGKLVVEPKTFETRRLRVAQQFATPPASEAERIARDARVLASVFEQVTPERLWRGPFDPPVPGAATSSFGRLSILNGNPGSRHQGADFRAATGTPVLAPNAGRVVLAEELYFAGNTVILDHGLGLFSLFAHLSRIAVDVGTVVHRGDRIGEAGATGRVTGPHLHWAVRMNALSVNPVSLLAAADSLRERDDIVTAP